MSGRLIVFEGTDGSGKSTQFRLLCRRMEEEGHPFHRLVFPRYDQPSSALIRMYLAGEFGSRPEDVNAYAASSFYAVDRYASWKQDWGSCYRKGGLVLSDRYTTSNAVHQACKLPEGEWEAFFRWLDDFEHGKLGLPRPDLVLYLDMPRSRPSICSGAGSGPRGRPEISMKWTQTTWPCAGAPRCGRPRRWAGREFPVPAPTERCGRWRKSIRRSGSRSPAF